VCLLQAVRIRRFRQKTEGAGAFTTGMEERDYFKEDILENAISQRQRERKERRELQRNKKNLQNQKARIAAEKAKRRRRILLAALVALVIAAIFVGRSVYKIMELQREKREAQARLEEIQHKIELMEEELTRITSDDYVEQQARSHLKMIFPGETLYIIVPRSSGSQQNPVPSNTTNNTNNAAGN